MKKFFLLCAICASIIACEKEPVGALPGKFTINAAGDQIVFAQGNLQYQASTGKWQFAANQYDMVGAENVKIAADYDGWIDLFGWGTGNNPTLTSADSADYATFTDWGVNPIVNGGNKANVWRSLTKDEMDYIYLKRPNASNLRGFAEINGVYGCVFLPDNWNSNNFIALPSDTSVAAQVNVYTLAQWKEMEQSGAVFLPAAGGRIEKATITVGSWGLYWLATKKNEAEAYATSFCIKGQDVDHYFVHYAFSVRLVKSVK